MKNILSLENLSSRPIADFLLAKFVSTVLDVLSEVSSNSRAIRRKSRGRTPRKINDAIPGKREKENWREKETTSNGRRGQRGEGGKKKRTSLSGGDGCSSELAAAKERRRRLVENRMFVFN